MNKEQVDKWLKEEYGMTFEELEELHDFQCDRVIEKAKEIERLQEKHDILKHTLEANIEHQKKLKEENKQLKSIIKEVRELLKNDYFEDGSFTTAKRVFELLDKVEENK